MAEPTPTPVTTPFVPTVATVATAVLALVHTPPVVASPNVIAAPEMDTLDGPVIAAGEDGTGLTVIVAKALQPLLNE